MRTTEIGLALTISLLGPLQEARSATFILGDQDFVDGQTALLADFNSSGIGEPSPFSTFVGSDLGRSNAASFGWTMSFPTSTPLFGVNTVTLGLYDHDSAAQGSQVAQFLIDGIDFTADLDSLFESLGGANNEYNTYTLTLPPSMTPLLADGSASFQLDFQGRALGQGLSTFLGNGAGLDFAELTFTIPEPSRAVLIVAGFGLILLRRKRSISNGIGVS